MFDRSKIGNVYTWGGNEYGELGRGKTCSSSSHPCVISDFELYSDGVVTVAACTSILDRGDRFIAITANTRSFVLLSVSGIVAIFGQVSAGQLAAVDMQHQVYGSTAFIQWRPSVMPRLAQFQWVHVACGTEHVVALNAAGQAYVFDELFLICNTGLVV